MSTIDQVERQAESKALNEHLNTLDEYRDLSVTITLKGFRCIPTRKDILETLAYDMQYGELRSYIEDEKHVQVEWTIDD